VTTTSTQGVDELCINTIRTLAVDAVQAADSGHPGTPMAMAPVVYTLWQQFLRFDPTDPIWPNRDRLVLSMGHASMLLWSLLHLTDVQAVDAQYEVLGQPAVTLDDIRRLRQLDSKCPSYPEYRWTPGVETTTGPLGQGIATSVGLAIAERLLADHFNRPDFVQPLFDYDVLDVLIVVTDRAAQPLESWRGLRHLPRRTLDNHLPVERVPGSAWTRSRISWAVYRVDHASISTNNAAAVSSVVRSATLSNLGSSASSGRPMMRARRAKLASLNPDRNV
jgi:hypothetical protein